MLRELKTKAKQELEKRSNNLFEMKIFSEFDLCFYYRPLLQLFFAKKILTILRKVDLNLKFKRK
jgi:hypothetical protein